MSIRSDLRKPVSPVRLAPVLPSQGINQSRLFDGVFDRRLQDQVRDVQPECGQRDAGQKGNDDLPLERGGQRDFHTASLRIAPAVGRASKRAPELHYGVKVFIIPVDIYGDESPCCRAIVHVENGWPEEFDDLAAAERYAARLRKAFKACRHGR